MILLPFLAAHMLVWLFFMDVVTGGSAVPSHITTSSLSAASELCFFILFPAPDELPGCLSRAFPLGSSHQKAVKVSCQPAAEEG